MRTRWLAAGVVLLVGAACSSPDSQASSDPTLASPSATVVASAAPSATMQASAGQSGATAILPVAAGPPGALEPGTYQTPDDVEPRMTITLPTGWFGAADPDGFAVGRGLDEIAERFAEAEINVQWIDVAYAEAIAAFQDLPGLSSGQNDPIETGVSGYPATTFQVHATGAPVLLDGVAPGSDVLPQGHEVTLVDVEGSTLLIRSALFDESAGSEFLEVLSSLTIGR